MRASNLGWAEVAKSFNLGKLSPPQTLVVSLGSVVSLQIRIQGRGCANLVRLRQACCQAGPEGVFEGHHGDAFGAPI